ncbi:hypothetical protein IW139_004769 [Coemansia sp. RSA 353]|nr:hypothetical protein GGH17_001732 [Coemansia sp. RSA 788]KAJ2161753.1 hypothetical protein GGH15_004751 [Coemansia sp. RSA 562]KAJ2171775.1 hypothetical protein GGH16_002677 [Coemansia sp. RSA 560]KAJ2184205.1 hypothetical protein EV181_004500 [Coemansia sp. RSA 532]KAJ2191883.1 hypothetical protein IW144_005130 [Coemansia sp. RSA 522]KAJ2194184.1 hypothetical protein GGH18_002305 [Coemansia sp. RSA 530]KAJ2221685.1 hypothetical protein IW143_001727 [Coemansia sp. RSA 520]KAJ2223914.1 hyp
MALCAKGAIKVINSDLCEADRTFSDANEKLDGTALYMLNAMLDSKISKNIKNENAFELWKKLNDKYVSETINRIVGQVQELINCRMEPDDIDSHMYWDSYCAIVRNIQFDKITREQLVRVIGLAGLNEKFLSISVEFGKVNDANLDEDKIGECMYRVTDTLTTFRSNGNMIGGASKHHPTCNYCGKLGHMEKVCYKKQNDERHENEGNGRDRGGGYEGGRNDKPKPGSGGSKGHKMNLKLGRLLLLGAHAALGKVKKSDTWLLDSGANASSCYSWNVFDTFSDYQDTMMTMLGESMNIRGKGTAKVGDSLSVIGAM